VWSFRSSPDSFCRWSYSGAPSIAQWSGVEELAQQQAGLDSKLPWGRNLQRTLRSARCRIEAVDHRMACRSPLFASEVWGILLVHFAVVVGPCFGLAPVSSLPGLPPERFVKAGGMIRSTEPQDRLQRPCNQSERCLYHCNRAAYSTGLNFGITGGEAISGLLNRVIVSKWLWQKEVATDSLLFCDVLSSWFLAFPVENAALDATSNLGHRHIPLDIDADILDLERCVMKADASDGGVRTCSERPIVSTGTKNQGRWFGLQWANCADEHNQKDLYWEILEPRSGKAWPHRVKRPGRALTVTSSYPTIVSTLADAYKLKVLYFSSSRYEYSILLVVE